MIAIVLSKYGEDLLQEEYGNVYKKYATAPGVIDQVR